MRRLWPLIWIVGFAACSAGSIQPIEIDLSKHTPTPAPPAPTATPAPAPTAPPPPPPPAAAPESAPVSGSAGSPADVVRAQGEAYNRHDLEGVLERFAPDAVLYDFPDRVTASGIDQIRSRFAARFAAAPDVRLTLQEEMVQGNFVIDRVAVAGFAGAPPTLVVISEVRDGKVRRAWLLR